MKNKILIGLALISATALGSCRKNYTCTCNTSTGTVTTTEMIKFDDATQESAQNRCSNYQVQANDVYLGSTRCHL